MQRPADVRPDARRRRRPPRGRCGSGRPGPSGRRPARRRTPTPRGRVHLDLGPALGSPRCSTSTRCSSPRIRGCRWPRPSRADRPTARTATISPMAASIMSSTWGPMSSTAPRSSRQPCANGPPRNAPEMKHARPPVGSIRFASARNAGRAGSKRYGEHHQVAHAGLGDGVDDRLGRGERRRRAAFRAGASCPPGRPGSRASGCASGVTAMATASHASKSASRSSKAGACSVSPSSCRVRRRARPDAVTRVCGPAASIGPGQHARPRAGADRGQLPGVRARGRRYPCAYVRDEAATT